MTSKPSNSGQRGSEDGIPLLPLHPPHWIVLGTAWLIVGFFAACVLASVLIHLPETIRCPCSLVPEGGADPIQSPRHAIMQSIRVAEGQTVAAGEELFVLKSEEAGDLDTQARTLAEDLSSRERNLKQLDVTDAADLRIKDHEIGQADEEVRFLSKTVDVEHDLLSRVEKLYSLGTYSQTEVILRRLSVAGSEKDLNVAQRAMQELVLQRQQMTEDQARRRSDLLTEIKDIEIRKGALEGQLEDSRRGLISVRAPYDGVVISLAQRNVGGVLLGGQELCQLARTGGKLKLRLTVAEVGLARLAVGQHLRFLAEAFPYQRYGTVTGTVSWISPAAVSSRDGQQFVALAALDRDAFQIGERSIPLRVGMKGEARIVVGTRTLIEYALEPLRQLRENMAGP